MRLDGSVDLSALVGRGDHRRKKFSTLRNTDSSRSHAVLRLHIVGPLQTNSLLHFVDLAGSENILTHYLHHPNDFNARKSRIAEGKKINSSLFYLNLVIKLLSEKQLYIPFRNSPLTKILKQSLGGNSKTLIILCITPLSIDIEKTLETLKFGFNAK